MPTSRSLVASALACGALAGCATGSPMLAPARVMRDGKIAVDVGSAYNAPVWSPSLSAAQSNTADADTALRAGITHGITPPGPVTYVAGRAGFGHRAEGSIALIGRVVRIGARRELWSSQGMTLAAGLAGRFAFLAGAYDGASPRLTVQESRLYGGDLSLVLGYARRDLYDLWIGARAGYLYNDAQMMLAPGGTVVEARSYAIGAHRFEAALHLGMRVGFGRFAAAVELETAFAFAAGDATWSGGTSSQSAASLTLIPAAALSYNF